MVFIKKPGRVSCAQGKSFRSIYLSSFLLQTPGKLIDREIRVDALKASFASLGYRK